MSSISAPQGAGAGGYKPIGAYQSLSQLNESRRVTVDTTASYDNRQRMAQTLSIAEERSLVDATKDIAASLFNAFRTELGEALSHIGIKGEKAAEIVRDMSKAFVEAVRDGAGFSFSMIAAAYKETITQTASSVSHALEFTASSLSIDYNQATGELAVDTSKLKIDAVKTIQSDNLPAETQGVVIADVAADGRAAEAGLRPGDVIERVGATMVRNPADVTAALTGTKRSSVLLLINRGGNQLFVGMKLAVA